MYVKVIGTKSNRNNFLRPLQIERRCMSGQNLFVVYLKKILEKNGNVRNRSINHEMLQCGEDELKMLD